MYCVTCKDWFCSNCLHLSPDQLRTYATTDTPYFCRDCSKDHYCPICFDICRDKCLFCQHCERFVHSKCTKLTRGQIRSQAHNYICSLCVKSTLPINVITNETLATQVSEISLPIRNNTCNLCIECNSECFDCDVCPDLQRVCGLCLSCKNYDINSFNELLSSTYEINDKLFVMHLNTCSLTANFTKLEQLLAVSNKVPDIIAISETRLNDSSNMNCIQLPGYSFRFKHSVTGSSCFGGVGLYIRENLNYKELPNLSFDFDGCETYFIEVNIKNCSAGAIIGVVYRHPHDNHTTFYDHLSKVLDNILSTLID